MRLPRARGARKKSSSPGSSGSTGSAASKLLPSTTSTSSTPALTCRSVGVGSGLSPEVKGIVLSEWIVINLCDVGFSSVRTAPFTPRISNGSDHAASNFPFLLPKDFRCTRT